MRIDIVTLFPELCDSFLHASILGRAAVKNLFEAHCHQIRDYTKNKQRQTDDHPNHGADEGEELAPDQQAGNRALAVEQHADGDARDDRRDAGRDLPGERVDMGVVSGQILRQGDRNSPLPRGKVRRCAKHRGPIRRRIIRRTGDGVRRHDSRRRRRRTIGLRRLGISPGSGNSNIAEHQIVQRAAEQVAHHQQLVHLRIRLA